MTTMSEEDRINLMRNVKSGELSVDQALKRFIRCEMIFFFTVLQYFYFTSMWFVFFLFRLIIFVYPQSVIVIDY